MRRVRLLLLYNELFFSCFGDESKLDTEEESGDAGDFVEYFAALRSFELKEEEEDWDG